MDRLRFEPGNSNGSEWASPLLPVGFDGNRLGLWGEVMKVDGPSPSPRTHYN